jgi:Cu-Zn family superoxide dismutase
MSKIHALLATVMLATTTGCATHGEHDNHEGGMGQMNDMHSMQPGSMAVASLTPTQGNNVHGTVMFHEMGEHLMVHVKVNGLAPNSEHGFHLHEKGDCASTDGTSAGGHFNPGKTAHGPQEGEHHAGDLPALKANAEGVVDQKLMLMGVTIKPGATSIDGRSVIIHANPDDYKTQPTGNSGARIACGVIAAH